MMTKCKFQHWLSIFFLAVSPLAIAESGCQAPTGSQPLVLSDCQQGDVLVLRGVNFATASAQLTPDSISLLDNVAQELMANPTVQVAIQGHTDAVGSQEYNLNLSRNRAQSVKNYLTNQGVNPLQLQSSGYGFSVPLASNDTASGRAANRRVEMKLVGTLVLAQPKPQKVYMSTFQAKPQVLTVPAGTEVTWVNYDEISHNVTFRNASVSSNKSSRVWNMPWLGETYSLTFDQPGEYVYKCDVHGDVNGRIVVEPRVDKLVTTESPVYPGQTTSSYMAHQSVKPYPSK
ncbi:OmpA family protein [Spongiibacter nanhainus]|uniref:OmpA family protein n=1 Tax=Spongiibacter nanhainus TaxID=2794344 RepID=A0A7T4QYZ3_9GAMM|nr:OmpA family protein [Spongiibacter nanhainus]QQD17385.1 OmpA family protein [Spongiibacter nanhainus]